LKNAFNALYNEPEVGEKMPSSVMTKRLFADALKKLMKSTPFAKISIGGITAECEMNRNSFYYHFKDKYELLNWVFLTEITEGVNNEEILETSSWELLERICNYFYKNRVFYANAMSYEGQNSFNNYFRDVLGLLIAARENDLSEEGMPQDTREFYMDFLVDTFATVITRWVKNGTKYTPEQFTNMIKKATTGAAIKILEDDDIA